MRSNETRKKVKKHGIHKHFGLGCMCVRARTHSHYLMLIIARDISYKVFIPQGKG